MNIHTSSFFFLLILFSYSFVDNTNPKVTHMHVHFLQTGRRGLTIGEQRVKESSPKRRGKSVRKSETQQEEKTIKKTQEFLQKEILREEFFHEIDCTSKGCLNFPFLTIISMNISKIWDVDPIWSFTLYHVEQGKATNCPSQLNMEMKLYS